MGTPHRSTWRLSTRILLLCTDVCTRCCAWCVHDESSKNFEGAYVPRPSWPDRRQRSGTTRVTCGRSRAPAAPSWRSDDRTWLRRFTPSQEVDPRQTTYVHSFPGGGSQTNNLFERSLRKLSLNSRNKLDGRGSSDCDHKKCPKFFARLTVFPTTLSSETTDTSRT